MKFCVQKPIVDVGVLSVFGLVRLPFVERTSRERGEAKVIHYVQRYRNNGRLSGIRYAEVQTNVYVYSSRVCRATEHWTEYFLLYIIYMCVYVCMNIGRREERDIESIFSDYIHRDDWFCADRTTRYLERGATKGIWLPEFMPGGCVTC